MPLKHAIETRLVVALAAVVLLTGFLLSTLPPFPQAVIPWCILLVATVAYPVLLYPLFKRDRADNTFRLLHWFPAAMVVLWMVLELMRTYAEPTAPAATALRWGWMLPVIVFGLAALILFCLHVIRRREKRVLLILLLLLPFAALAAASERGLRLERIVANALWNAEPAPLVADVPDDRNLDPSTDPREEKWRESLRAVERRERALERLKDDEGSSSVVAVVDSSASSAHTSSAASDASGIDASSSSLPDALRPGGTGTHLREVKNGPNALPESGFGWGLVLLSMGAAYCGTLHDRARRRS